MTEELREGINGLIGDCLIKIGCGESGCIRAERMELEAQEILLDGIIKLLSDMGCGIWTEKPLSANPYGDTGKKAEADDPNWKIKMLCYNEAQQDMLKWKEECFTPIE